MTRIGRLASEGFWIVAGEAGGVVGSLMLVRVLTANITPAEYGRLSLGLTVAGFVNQIVIGALSAGIGRVYAIAAQTGNVRGYFGVARRLTLYATGLIVGLAALLVAVLAWRHLGEWIAVSVVAVAFAAFSGHNGILNNIQTVARQRQIVAWHLAAEPWLRLLFAFLLIRWIAPTTPAVIGGYAVAAVLLLQSQLFFVRRVLPVDHGTAPDAFDWQGLIWTNSWPIAAWGVFSWAQLASDRWALEAFATRAAVGEYAVLYQLGYAPVSLATGFLMTFIGPIVFQRAGTDPGGAGGRHVAQLTWRLTAVALALTAAMTAVALVTHRLVFTLFTAQAYWHVSRFLPGVALAGGLFATGQILSLKPTADLQLRKLVAPKIGTAVVGVGTNVILARWYGVGGVVAALNLASIVYVVWLVAILRAPAVEAARLPLVTEPSPQV